MAETFTSYSVDNDRSFRDALNRARKKTSDLTIPLTLISKDFYKSQKAIFKLKGPGQYPDLAPSTKREKQRKVGFIYPILKRSGALERATTDPTDANAINEIVNKDTLIIGVSGALEYPVFHQSDAPRDRLPLRKFLFIGPEAIRFATNEQKGRLERWLGIVDGYMGEVAKSEGFGN